MNGWALDLRFAARLLTRQPGFTAVAVLSLALGLGWNTTIFSLFSGLLLRPLPVAHPEEVVSIYTSDSSGPLYSSSSYLDVVDFAAGAPALRGVAAYTMLPVNLGGEMEAERRFAQTVSAGFFDLLGVRPALGRAFLPEEEAEPGAHAVVVLSDALWRERFAARPDIVGRAILLNGRSFTVVGVAPRGFRGVFRGFGADMWIPLAAEPILIPRTDTLTNRGDRSLFALGRLRPGATRAQAQAQLAAVAAEHYQAHREAWSDREGNPRKVSVLSERESRIFPMVRTPVLGFLGLLQVIVGLVLLAACANLASLLLARASTRGREIAVRLAVGAGRGRLVRQLLTESVMLSLLAGVVGLLLAFWAIDLLMAMRPPFPVPLALEVQPDLRVLLFTLLLSVATGVLFGLAPALQATRPDLLAVLKDESSSGPGGARARLRDAFLVAQVALSLLLLIGSGLFLRGLHQATKIDPGFRPEGLVLASLDLGSHGYADADGAVFYARLLDELRARPGVSGATLTSDVPLDLGNRSRGFSLGGGREEALEEGCANVGPDFFEVMGIPLVRGRGITAEDRESTQRVAVVNETFARRFWPGEDPLGRPIYDRGLESEPLTVVGIARDGKYNTLGEEPRPFYYYALRQEYESESMLVVRGGRDAGATALLLRDAVRGLDPTLPVFDLKPMERHLEVTLFPARLAATLLALFGAVALALAAVGLYGVMSYHVARRTREIGVRMALGARGGDVVRMVAGHGLRLTAAGLLLGAAAAAALTRFVRGMLFGVAPTDPLTFAGVALLLLAVAVAACVVPARRAVQLDPMQALRYE